MASSSADGSGTKCRVSVAKLAKTGSLSTPVDTKIGVTSWIVPDAAAVLEVPEAAPCANPIRVIVPTAAVAGVHGAPITVWFRPPVMKEVPPPTRLEGTSTLAIAVADSHAANTQNLAAPASGIPLPNAVPAPSWAVSWKPARGKAPRTSSPPARATTDGLPLPIH